MKTAVKKLYEGMFLIDSAEAARDWDGILDFIRATLTRADAEIIAIRKWDERPLAYTIRRCSRGTYILTYFRADGEKIRDIERDVQLSERIIRVLILRAEQLTEEDVNKEPQAARAENQPRQPAQREVAPEQAKPSDEASEESDQEDFDGGDGDQDNTEQQDS